MTKLSTALKLSTCAKTIVRVTGLGLHRSTLLRDQVRGRLIEPIETHKRAAFGRPFLFAPHSLPVLHPPCLKPP